ncbi:uncharacterized protein LOC127797686 [Diospyros lotus]|uniref:uncharacterized protein LOC127797686 n=1 Tax=Diospyros lotus TaxID=55363 RepID=UPI00224DDDEF|nr:uncharacterized protein LOC127797686 [Diospyros lotus]
MEQNMMFHRQAGGRNLSRKGFKFSRVFQVALLSAVCIWTVYEITHPDDKPGSDNPFRRSEVHNKEQANMLTGRKGLAVAAIMAESVQKGLEDPWPWSSDAAAGGEERDELLEKGERFVGEKLKVERVGDDEQVKEEKDQGEMEIEFNSFDDENGVPPDSLRMLDSPILL